MNFFHESELLSLIIEKTENLMAELTPPAILLGWAHDSKQRLVFRAAGRRWIFWPPPGRLDAVLMDHSKTMSRPRLSAPFSNPYCYDRSP